MGNPKQKWTPEEEEALRRGIKKYGTGKWKHILTDPEYSPYLRNRTNIDLKDKWRNLTSGVVPRGGDISRAQRLKELTDVLVVAPLPVSPAPPLLLAQPPLALPPPASSTPVSKDVKKVPDTEDPSKCVLSGKVVSEYTDIIYEALSTLNEPNGSDTTSIINYFEKKGERPNQKFRKKITERLRRLAASGKLVKLPNHFYKLKTEDTPEGTKIPIPKPNNARLKAQPPQPKAANTQSSPQPEAQPPTQPKAEPPTQPQVEVLQTTQVPIRGYLGDSLEEATLSAALAVSDAENKSFVVAEAVMESERVAVMSEETDRMLHLALEILKRSKPKRKREQITQS